MSCLIGAPAGMAASQMKAGSGRLSVTWNVLSSTALRPRLCSAPSMVPASRCGSRIATLSPLAIAPAKNVASGEARRGSQRRRQAKTKSCALTGWPSQYSASLRRWNTYTVPLFITS